MVKHNNVVPNGHFRKDWQRFIKTWFDQPAKKVARRQAREARATKLAPRPIGKLRPVVHGQTIKYNLRVRAGRGFTIAELKAAGITKREAMTIGIAVDHRRKNRSEEGFKANVDRLKLYKSKLVVYPLKNYHDKQRAKAGKTKAGDADAKEIEASKAVDQNTLKSVLPIVQPAVDQEPRKITKDEKEKCVFAVLRKAWNDQYMAGKRAKEAAEAAANKTSRKR
mmetsp:Transcript_5260/g.10008  ORF Transcript_5260/g.10008 Transcript_5260/m.10008 type:complete len:223 (+) Transcript_5260:33-701(+)